jgi:hypothetical protein
MESLARLSKKSGYRAALVFASVPSSDTDLPDGQGLSDAQIQLISRHETKKSLEVCQHSSLESAENPYQNAVQSIWV